MAKQALIFDMDGVLINTEKIWLEDEGYLFDKLFEPEIISKIGETRGVAISQIYARAKALGSKISQERFNQIFNDAAKRVYAQAQLSNGVEEVINWAKKQGWKVGLLSSSPQDWIEQLLSRVNWGQELDLVLGINEHPRFHPKPSPDGYLGICELLGVKPTNAVAVEDSRSGIKAATSAGLITIGYREYVESGFNPGPTPYQAKNMQEVLSILPLCCTA